ncbi:DUF1801 domain-containing protein [Chryseobacterium caseinilyticum]|uniref:DUF1801 domain-containing protein n=1 Tax=Chryseobacterium caseinilyticum TaxID=2771428 RepID=A0ABR8ZB94_9FLAO|nr:DUF1801 domain-containing protein [Chryseobacterium caseinilyticum]MBD8082599.1 DUF1801 domain-containing protein [Chryseobacterium caseinilyticum]
MASKNKTAETEIDVDDFIHSFVESEQKKQDSFQLIELMKKWSGFEPKIWGPTMIGFGSYHYKYESGHEGDAMIIGFSPRKAQFSLYVAAPEEEDKKLLESLGRFKMAKACIYFKKLSDLNLDILEKLCQSTIKYIREHNECVCR